MTNDSPLPDANPGDMGTLLLLLASVAFLVAEMLGVKWGQKSKESRKNTEKTNRKC